MNKIKYIAFDADDTLWINEPLYQEAEKEYQKLLSDYLPEQEITNKLLDIERVNIKTYGFGAKSFTLSMIENAIKISKSELKASVVEKIIKLGKGLLTVPVEIIDGVEEALEKLSYHYILLVATKGDLTDQERKLKTSGLENYFHHIEIMSDKNEQNYKKLVEQLDISPSELLMVGNSLRSDIIPALKIGCKAIYIPFHTIWAHEVVEEHEYDDKFLTVNSISEIPRILLNEN